MSADFISCMADGYKLMPNGFMVERGQVRFPRSKSRRIRKKWSKRFCNFGDVPMQKVWILKPQRMIVGHPKLIKSLVRLIEKKESV